LANYFSAVKSQKLGRFEVKNDQNFFVLRPLFSMILIRQQYQVIKVIKIQGCEMPKSVSTVQLSSIYAGGYGGW
jgi:hypothetical protein